MAARFLLGRAIRPGTWLRSYTELLAGYDFNLVSPTAYFPVIARGEFTDIPFAREMLADLKPELPSLEGLPPGGLRSYAPFFEARFKSVSRILMEQGAKQILELAAGFSPRGMEFSQRPDFRDGVYVEADLPDMIERKRGIVAALLGSVPQNLKLCQASVLNRTQLEEACAAFRQTPVAVTAEGLLRYLTFPEKEELAANVIGILRTFGGCWITPDIHTRHWAAQRRDHAFRERVESKIGRDLDGNYFDDEAHARSFFESCGFAVEERPLLEGIREEVVSLKYASPAMLEQLETRRTFVLRVDGGR
jgi:O-methyltransferase involved in polyketide biosynthesis